MNITLWFLQTALALHTAVGAIWKFSHSAQQTMVSLQAIPHSLWVGMAIVELVASVLLILPMFSRPAGRLVPLAALFIMLEMLVFCLLYLSGGQQGVGPLAYWLVVAAIAAWIAYGRYKRKPL
ncbi:hypothetical protein A11A3_01175 [Alcanivorax hongdengensis A-11-3]|uniref:DoxX family protein n=1 Tax=Alcanivorax hongdengensis A-11-3 TaxID=1177179 RepID=L0WGS2_9GAMM|nr:hypothetical protein [Alcanivorax hongdengensis]EKF76063.1 hypothetical protein A11A3_01175 [Alcanivorax hongdengensis A-11-3]